MPQFKQVLVKEEAQDISQKLKSDLESCTSKLEISILALLHCQGSFAEKQRFLMELIDPHKSEKIQYCDRELVFVTKNLFYMAKDLPLEFLKIYKSGITPKVINKLSLQEIDEKLECYYEQFYEGKLVDIIYPDGTSLIPRRDFDSKLQSKQKFGWLFNRKHLRNLIKESNSRGIVNF